MSFTNVVILYVHLTMFYICMCVQIPSTDSIPSGATQLHYVFAPGNMKSDGSGLQALRMGGMTPNLLAMKTQCMAGPKNLTKTGWGGGGSAMLADVKTVLNLAAHMKQITTLRFFVDFYFDKDFSMTNQKSK